MIWTLLALVLLVATGAFISYYGDLQGRRWGKKRVSWFGLRPKHTAILITSITGAVIALLSVGAVMLVVPTVGEVVLHGEAAIRENERLRKQFTRDVETLRARLKESSLQLAAGQAALEETNRQVERTHAQIAALQQTNVALQKTNGSLISGNMDKQRQQAQLERSIKNNQQLLLRTEKDNKNADYINRLLGRQNSDLIRQKENLEAERSRLLRSNSTLLASNETLKNANAALTADNSRLTMSYNAANEAFNRLLDENQKEQEKQNELRTAYGRLKVQIDDLTSQRDELSAQLAGTSRDFARTYLALRQARYTLRADTELARRSLNARLTPEATRAEILALLKDASDRARQFGAAMGSNGRTVAIVPKRVVTPNSIELANENTVIDAVVSAVADSATPVVVVARAINNSIANEQVLIEIGSFASVTVFRQGDSIASRVIDSRQSLDGIVQGVIAFLKEDVRNAAIRSGTIPQISPVSGEEEVGVIDTPEMVTLVDRIRRAGGMVRLTAVAHQTLTSADLLVFGQANEGRPHNLRFDLKRVPDRVRRKGDVAIN